jgi:hypothetical protein
MVGIFDFSKIQPIAPFKHDGTSNVTLLVVVERFAQREIDMV